MSSAAPARVAKHHGRKTPRTNQGSRWAAAEWPASRSAFASQKRRSVAYSRLETFVPTNAKVRVPKEENEQANRINKARKTMGFRPGATANVLRHDDPEKVWYTQGELSSSLKEMRQIQHCDEGALQTMISELLFDGAGPKKKKRIVLQDRRDRSSRVPATHMGMSGEGNQDVEMKDADKEGWDVDEDSRDKEVSKSWRCSDGHDGGLSILGALGEVQGAGGRHVPRLNQGGGIALVRIIMSGVGMNRTGKSLYMNLESAQRFWRITAKDRGNESSRCDGNSCKGTSDV